MKRITTPALLFLLLVTMMASLMPVAAGIIVSDPADCPAGTTPVPVENNSLPNNLRDIAYECVEVPVEPPTDTCDVGIEPCEPPTDPCGKASFTSCPPSTDPKPERQPVYTSRDTQDSVSFNDSDLGVSLFVSQDASGRPMLQVYETLNNDTNGDFAMTITQDDLAPFVGALPAENTMLKSQGHVRIFVLTTGEISILVGPDSEGKVHVKIFDGIPWSNVYGYTIDPQ